MLRHTEFTAQVKRAYQQKKNCVQQNQNLSIYAASIYDINKMLSPKKHPTREDIITNLPDQLQHHHTLFETDHNDSRDLPPHRPGVDLAIEIEKDEQGRTKDLPKGPLYNMSRDELLCLRKEMTELLDRNWIRASSSPGGAPVLFVKKPGGGLRFCVDYRSLNAITKSDRYPLPLIKETLRSIAKARWISKMDVSAAFHRIRVKEGDEWKTAFQTRLGLFEWLVMPFGLTGAPAAWQRWINHLLRDYLDVFCTAYLDDILVWSEGSREEHLHKVNRVLDRLADANLKLDLKKCNFAVKEVKYLGFKATAGKGVSVDPEKQEAIKKWELPRTQTGVRSFLGFANFYRDFINDFASLSAPLQRYTKKEFSGKGKIHLDHEARQAFEKLKEHFITAPILALFDPDRRTVLETDCSGWAMGACLSQWDSLGKLRPVGYFSKKLSPAECNYDIHDKELLAIIKAVEFWRAELTCLQYPVEILTDHKNLQYFMSKRTLTERQIRWKSTLDNLPGIKLHYRPGCQATRPDALSRLEQDTPTDPSDPRLHYREMKLINQDWLVVTEHEPGNKSNIDCKVSLFEEKNLNNLWKEGINADGEYRDIRKALINQDRCFSTSITVKISISECSIDRDGNVRWRERLLVPAYEPLQTALIHRAHDSPVTGHPGRDVTLSILSRNFYWPRMSNMVRRFVRNCDICGRTHVWRDKKRGFLKPFPVPERFHQEISIDFMTDLPGEKDQPHYLMVITDRLSKEITLEAMTTMSAEACANRFLQCFYRFHGFPKAITSDRGSNWVGDFWTRLCERTGIEQRLSTAFHPQTDGATERANQEIQAFLRAFVTYAQNDWANLLPSAQLALNNRDSSLGYSPFFLNHGYHISPFPITDNKPNVNQNSIEQLSLNKKKADSLFQKILEGQMLAQAAMAWRQQIMEDSANRTRQQSHIFKEGDPVWLNLRNIATPRPSKKLAWLHAKYRVIKVISPHVVELDVPTGIHPRFHVYLLKKAAEDPLPSQFQDDYLPKPVNSDTSRQNQEFKIERILRAEKRRRGRGFQRMVLVKWQGQAELSWEPRSEFEETLALSDFENMYGTADNVGSQDVNISTKKKKKKY